MREKKNCIRCDNHQSDSNLTLTVQVKTTSTVNVSLSYVSLIPFLFIRQETTHWTIDKSWQKTNLVHIHNSLVIHTHMYIHSKKTTYSS